MSLHLVFVTYEWVRGGTGALRINQMGTVRVRSAEIYWKKIGVYARRHMAISDIVAC